LGLLLINGGGIEKDYFGGLEFLFPLGERVNYFGGLGFFANVFPFFIPLK